MFKIIKNKVLLLTMESTSFVKLSKAIDLIDTFFKDIERYFNEKDILSIHNTLKIKKALMKRKRIKGFVMLKNQKPEGIAWVELVSNHYGNIVIHNMHEESQAELAEYIADSSIMDGAFLELISFVETDTYRNVFTSRGISQHERSRMALDLDNDFPFPDTAPYITFKEIEPEDIIITSRISFRAHQISKDYGRYSDLETIEKRLQLERIVFQEKQGRIVKPATILMYYNEIPIGTCIITEVAYWGLEKVPWIFDISLTPEYHGQHLGETLIKQSIATLAAMGYPVVGLAVTVSNTSAIRLYEKLGFYFSETFFEFMKTPKKKRQVKSTKTKKRPKRHK
ncbi:MAG: GNAT family N-acetyltransferase [bacterium]|nr:GNAT family N-acetyltransferase [bacterium]